ncbi:uncharacterized protein BYT42DRAFT_579586 [Radiomyces spectabilis]|uniref:uncharacterized protein n=1 Tax=Radiomyces spectabilis TaxID=64574 RepID=UPI0022204745|nr:uncharacterized protein BYT42DRAFT_579586 [Radiomyces spectabilis]KAI8373207.1 hypothetical protein BYT42DRAFT_579586 [Radiomyces spectabilis]
MVSFSFTTLAIFAVAQLALLKTIAAALDSNASQCQGVNILFPKQDSEVSISNQQTAYLVLGNTNEGAHLKQVDLLRKAGDKTLSKKLWIPGNDQEEILSKVTAVQQDLRKLDTSLPDTFWYRIHVQQDGKECTYESDPFKITK